MKEEIIGLLRDCLSQTSQQSNVVVLQKDFDKWLIENDKRINEMCGTVVLLQQVLDKLKSGL